MAARQTTVEVTPEMHRLEVTIDNETLERLDEIREDESYSAWIRRQVDHEWRCKKNVIVETRPDGTVITRMVPEDQRVPWEEPRKTIL